MSKQREAEGVNEDKFREMKSADRRPVQQKVSGMRARWGHQENGWVGSGMADAVGQVNGIMEVGAWDGTYMLQDPQIIKDGTQARDGQGVFRAGSGGCHGHGHVPGGSGHGVCVVSGRVLRCG